MSELDLERLHRVLDGHASMRDSEVAEMLETELSRARVVAPHEIPAHVVTMNSRVVFEEETTGTRRDITLVYPQDADPRQGKISILAPVGSALLGLSVGQSIDWPLPGGRTKRYRIVEILYQPEAAGDYHL